MLKIFILLLPCMVCAYSAITLFINRNRNSRSQNIWMICMMLFSVSAYAWAFYYIGVEDFKLYSKLDIISATCGLTFLPFVRLYFKSLTDEAKLNWKKESLWFLPSLYVGLGSLVLYFLMGEDGAEVYMQALFRDGASSEEFSAPVYQVHYVVNILSYYVILLLQVILVLRYTVLCLTRYRKKLDDFFSNPEGKSLENIKAMLVTLFIMLVIYLLGFLEMYVFSNPLLIYFLMAGFAATLYSLSYLAIKVKYTAENLAKEVQQSDKEAEERGYATIDGFGVDELKPVFNMNRYKWEELVWQINRLLDEDKIYLQKDLRIDDIVRITQVNRTYISLLIREEYCCTFSELINDKRIAYAQRLMLENSQMSHAQVAEEAGFNHASSFSRTFKKRTGMTFKEWYVKNSTN